MTTPLTTASDARHTAVAELFDALEALMFVYQAPSEAERVQCWSADAERITGEVARYLCAARTRIAQRPHTVPHPGSEEFPDLGEF